MCSVVQNPLPDHDIAGVPLVISAGVQIAVVFRECRVGDDDAQTMPAGITRDVNQRVREADELNSGGNATRSKRSSTSCGAADIAKPKARLCEPSETMPL